MNLLHRVSIGGNWNQQRKSYVQKTKRTSLKYRLKDKNVWKKIHLVILNGNSNAFQKIVRIEDKLLTVFIFYSNALKVYFYSKCMCLESPHSCQLKKCNPDQGCFEGVTCNFHLPCIKEAVCFPP